jgi:nitroreductase
MELSAAIYTRRSVSEYTTQPVDDKTIRELINAAVQAPSAVNRQPWSFCVERDKALLARISRDAKAHMLKNTLVGLLSPRACADCDLHCRRNVMGDEDAARQKITPAIRVCRRAALSSLAVPCRPALPRRPPACRPATWQIRR